MKKSKAFQKKKKTSIPQSSSKEKSPPLRSDLLKILLPLLLGALIFKLVFLFSVHTHPFITHLSVDEVEHDHMARQVLEAGLLQQDAFYFAPLYPYLLAGYYALFGFHILGFKIIQVLIGSLNVGVIYLLAKRLFQERSIAVLAALITLLYGVFSFYEVLLLKTTFAIFFSNIALLLLFWAYPKTSKTKWLGAGLFLGLATLLRGNVLLLIPAILAWLIWKSSQGRIKKGVVFIWVLGLALGLAPATAHNWLASKDLVLTTYQGGTNFFIGNHRGASGLYQPLRQGREVPAYEKADAVSLAEAAAKKDLSPSQVSSFWLRKGLSFIREHPDEWSSLTWRKFHLFHGNKEIPDSINYVFFKRDAPLLNLAFIPFWFIFLFAVLGFCLTLSKWKEYFLLYVLTGVSIFSVVLFFQMIKNRKWIPGVMILPAFFLLYSFSNTEIFRISEAASENNLGMIYLDMGKYDKALHHLRRALDGPDMFRVHANISRIYELKGDLKKAIAEKELVLDYIRKEGGRRDEMKQKEIAQISLQLLDLLKEDNQNERAVSLRKEIIQSYFKLIDWYNKHHTQGDQTKRIKDIIFALHVDLGGLLHEEGLEGEAISILKQAVAINSQNKAVLSQLAKMHFDLAIRYQKEKKMQKSIAQFEEVLRIDPQNAVVHSNMGTVLFRQNKVDEAIGQYKKALSLDAEYAQAHNSLGVALIRQGKVQEAEEHFKKAVELQPEFKAAQNNLKRLQSKKE